MADEATIYAGTLVRFEVGPGIHRDGEIYFQFEDVQGLNYVLQYIGHDHVFYVVRRAGQFQITGEAPYREAR
jgi:hypothetical protein